MKKICLVFLMIAWVTILYGQSAKNGKMPITTKSETALKLFSQAERAFQDLNLNECINILLKAKKEDPDFFMADTYLALSYLTNNDIAGFKEYATAAASNKSKINGGEEQFKVMLNKLMQDQKADLSEQANKLIALYPDDQRGYSYLALYQLVKNDYQGALNTLSKAMKIADYKPVIYNLYGYAYMGLNKMEDAKKAFETYIELAPNVANAYDSMGDYYFQVKDYKTASKYFSKSAGLGLAASKPKAQKAQHMADSLGLK
jgi:tetratricopeptide (TPR) repeat protein